MVQLNTVMAKVMASSKAKTIESIHLSTLVLRKIGKEIQAFEIFNNNT
jgi:hypothetical protein